MRLSAPGTSKRSLTLIVLLVFLSTISVSCKASAKSKRANGSTPAASQASAAQIPVNAFRGEYFSGTTLSNRVSTRTDSAIDFDWGTSAPLTGLPPDGFSVRWEGDWDFSVSGLYRFSMTVDDGGRVWVDGTLVLDRWYDQAATTYAADVQLAAGRHRIKMEFYENSIHAVARLSWGPAPSQSTATPPSTTTSTTAPSALTSGDHLKYQAYFDSVYQANKTSFYSWAANPSAYYDMIFVLEALLDMYEATRDTRYADESLALVETMISKATVTDSLGFKDWPGIDWLWEAQGSVGIARFARVALDDATLASRYGRSRLETVRDFVLTHVIEKSSFVRGWLYGYDYPHGEAIGENIWGDRTTLSIRLFVEASRMTSIQKYRDHAVALIQLFVNRLKPLGAQGAIAWDIGIVDPEWVDYSLGVSGTVPHASADTGHSGREPLMLAAAHEAGIGAVTASHFTGLARLLTTRIWNGDQASPMFTNYLDGDNSQWLHWGPWQAGALYFGWPALGAYDADAQRVLEHTLDAIIAGVQNASMGFNAQPTGKLVLAGRLTRNLAKLAGQLD